MTDLTPLKTLTIANFRGVRYLEIDLHPRVTVLFGSNAAGKSTILDAISIALGSVVARVPRAQGRSFAKTGDLRVPALDRPAWKERRGVECEFASVHLDTAGTRWGATHWRSAADRKNAVKNQTASRGVHDRIDLLIREALDASPGDLTTPLPLFAAYGNERAVVEVPLRERDFQTEFRRLDAYNRSLRATTHFKTVFEWFRAMEDEERREREKRRDFGYRLAELEWVRRAVGLAELRCVNPRVETKPIRMVVDFDHGSGVTEKLDIASLSDGYRTHFALVVDVARRMVQLNPSPDLSDPHRGTHSPAVILIDEVDLHLDPPWQARVLQGLQSAFPNAQFVVTTHSEQVLGSVAAESVRRLSWVDGEIVVEDVPFAQGATGERILVELMGASERVAGPVTTKLERYLDLVSSGAGGSKEALALRAELDALLPGDARLQQADLEQQRRDLLRRMHGGTP